jgi:hypothetical protein
MELVREKRVGLKSVLVFQCNMCNIEQTVYTETEKEGEMDVNSSAVSATITTGGGHAQLEEFFSTMNVPPMSDKTFRKFEDKLCKEMMETAEAEMKAAAEEEARLAVEHGDVDEDGSWCKRSYRTNYSSLSGVVSVVYQTNLRTLSKLS